MGPKILSRKIGKNETTNLHRVKALKRYDFIQNSAEAWHHKCKGKGKVIPLQDRYDPDGG